MSSINLVVEREQLRFSTTRTFSASPQSLWRAMTEPDLIPKWWGPAKYSTVVEKHELRVGGVWRFVQTGPDGDVHAFNGVFKEIRPFEVLAYTLEYEPVAGHISTDTLTLEPLAGGKTRILGVTTFDNLEDLDGMLQAGMEEGASETWDRLDALATNL